MTSYTDVFNAGSINPAWVGYINYNITTNTTLSWPIDTNLSANVVAGFMQCQTTAGLSFIMPNAEQASTGTTCIFDNTGANQFTVKSSVAGTTLLTVASGTAWVLVLTDNSTADGTWLAFQLGAGSSTAIAASLAGFGIEAIGSTLNQDHSFFSKAVNYTVIASDQASVYAWTGGAGTFTLTAAATLGTGWFFLLTNQGTGALTVVDAGGATINGASSLILNPGDSCLLLTNGALWATVGLGKSATFAISFLALNVAPGGTVTLAGTQLNQIIYQFTGVLTMACAVVVPNTVQQYWVDNSTTGSFLLTLGTAAQVGPPTVAQGGRNIYYCDGTNVKLADTSGFATPLPVSAGGTGASTASGAQANLNVPSTLDAFTYVQMFS